MKKEEKELEFSDELKKHGWSEIDGSHRKNLSRKSRISIYLDSDVIEGFKDLAEKRGMGYQTLINSELRRIIDGSNKDDLKQELLRDRKFIKSLKEVLSA